jgi:deoxyribonuclease I
MKTNKFVLYIIVTFLASFSFAGNEKVLDFRAAKKFQDVLFKGEKTIYCHCDWTGKSIDKSCAVKPRKSTSRFYRTEIEHLVPMSYFSNKLTDGLSCGKKSKRACAGSKSKQFNLIEADLHNHAVSIGEVNGLRSDRTAMELPKGKKEFVGCDAKFDKDSFEPPDADKGVVARAYLYMEKEYGMHLDGWQRRMYAAWDIKYKPTLRECKRNELIKKIQGNENSFVSRWCGAN